MDYFYKITQGVGPFYKVTQNVTWDQTAYVLLRQEMSPARIKHDDKILASIFNLAADIPVLDAALSWARDHGIEFFIDHDATTCRGYYRRGSGIIGLSAHHIDKQKPITVVPTLVHEIRHAWQDVQGFSAYAPDCTFINYYMHVSLLEADSYVFEKQALKEIGALPDGEEGQKSDYFIEWFTWTNRPERYGDNLSCAIGNKLGLSNCTSSPPIQIELPHYATKARPGGLKFSSPASLQGLGADFASAANYMKDDGFANKLTAAGILTQKHARTFYGQASPAQKKRVAMLSSVRLFD